MIDSAVVVIASGPTCSAPDLVVIETRPVVIVPIRVVIAAISMAIALIARGKGPIWYDSLPRLAINILIRTEQALMRAVFPRPFSVIAAALMAALSVSAAHAQRRPATRQMTPPDILRVANVGDAQISPNGQWVVYTVSAIEGNETISTLWLARVGLDLTNVPTSTAPATSQRNETSDWGSARTSVSPLLSGSWNASNPRWSPDSSKIAFLSDHNNQSGLWVVNLDNRQPRFVAAVLSTNFFITYTGESLAWAPDSKRIAYISATEELTETPEANPPRDDPRVIDRIQYKSRTAFSDRRRTHVWITAIDRPEPQQLTSGYFYDHAITFSPSGDEIAFISNHEADPDANNNSDIFAVDLHGEMRQITATRGCEYEPAWSPDGKWIAYTATRRDVTTIDSVAEDTHVWVTDPAGKERRELTATQDRRARDPQWSGDSQVVLYVAGDRGCTTVFGATLRGSKPEQLLPNAFGGDQFSFLAVELGAANLPTNRYQVSNFSVAQKRNPRTGIPPRQLDSKGGWPVAFVISSSVQASEVWFYSGVSPQAHRLSGHNFEYSRSRDLVGPEEMTFRSFDGTRIQGWLMKPVEWRDDQKYPLILSIHGGPHGMSGWAFNASFQAYAAGGYAVLYLNPRGSSGYGQKFSDGTLNEWGGGDYKDLMLGVDEALRKYPWIDPNRIGVTGGSYGGFMTNWIITQTPRFRAAVSVASVSNLISFYSTSLYQDLIHAEFGGFPWDNYDLLWQWSPLRYVRQAQTPTLFIHGEQDNDVHITQAEEMYTALRRRGVETVLVRYPREGHGLREPKHRVDALERTLAWFDKYLK
ncbi:MAG TPA: S9 family peptidase [Pyrinomonadaceae bacterium]|nr:S9 family peptidase [Pyrinomonadaceae bacterium]